ncbi:MAG: AMP-binding protein [Candidatus Methanomethylophilaceae archaeon]|nr:AMP-binding protein [Candidatus Methanomethylophilaceae archaeon]MDY5872687.1 AMP-binding protein [Candidatus Methanomethylophilaceae archaeon]
MRNINQRYVRETYDKSGLLSGFDIECPDDFNFGYDVVDDIAVNDPGRRALVWAHENGESRTFTFADIKRMSDKTCNYLASKGIGKGDFVMLVLKHSYQFWYISVALHKMGAVVVPATYMLKPHDINYRINAAGIKAAIVTIQTDVADSFDATEDIPSLEHRFIVGGRRDGWEDFDTEVEKYPDSWERVPTKRTDRFLMYFTSGTSGNPKMAVHDYSYPLGHILLAKHWHQIDPDGLHWSVADTGWAKNAWGKIYGQWIMEGAVFVYEYEKFIPSHILDMIEKFRVTTFCCPPTMFRLYLNAGLEGHDLSSLKNCCIAGEALNPDTYNTWYNATGLKLMEAFGQTESSVIVGTLRGMEPKPGSMGRPSPQYDVRLVDEDGNEVPVGEEGEIVVSVSPRVPGIFKEYYKDERKTSETLRDGWHHTGDIAWKDEDGYFWYSGRNDDMIKSSGYRISPFEIESVLMEHPAVLECAVTGVPDPVRGQLVKATVVLREGYEPSEGLGKELQAYVKNGTSPYKYPRVVDFVRELPKSSSGKVKRVDIRNRDKGLS